LGYLKFGFPGTLSDTVRAWSLSHPLLSFWVGCGVGALVIHLWATPKMTTNVKVIDLSHHNTMDVDGFAKMREFGIRGVIHKSSQGVGYVDPQYAVRRNAAKSAGLLWGAYHFGDNRAVASQVDWFLKSAPPDADTLVALDFEPNADKTMTLDQCRGFLRLIEAKLGRKAVIYSGNLIKRNAPRRA
jgi:GH25 family lysozyme M1 (1,4-beta-N-acetylmuramidase)